MLRIVFLIVCIGAGQAALAEAWRNKLSDGFEDKNFASEGGLYYKENFEQSAGSLEFQNEVKRSGNGALKLSVVSVCPDSLPNCSERAEIWEETTLRVPYDQGIWYGFAVKFADPIPDNDHRYLIAQWKREIDPGAQGDFSPFLALRVKSGKLFATVETNYIAPRSERSEGNHAFCKDGEIPVWGRPGLNQMRMLVVADSNWTLEDSRMFNGCSDAIKVTKYGNPLPDPKSGWIDFAVFTRPGAEGTGHIELFANGNRIVTVEGHIGHSDYGLGKNQYFKFGPYRRAHHTDWALFYDDFRRSPNCVDVLKEASCPFL